MTSYGSKDDYLRDVLTRIRRLAKRRGGAEIVTLATEALRVLTVVERADTDNEESQS